MTPQTDKTFDDEKPAKHKVLCVWCGAVIRSSTVRPHEQMCLICHARMLNDYFQRLKQLSNEKRRG